MPKENNTAINSIIDNYVGNEENIVNQLYFKATHGPTIGGYREDIWKEMFTQIIPGKFVIEQSVFLIDSSGAVSKEVDLAIFDETYTPYIFRYGRLKFLPIESVAAVIECKSSSLKNKDLDKWAESIMALKTANKSFARMASGIAVGEDTKTNTTQTATRPLRILCKLTTDEVRKEAEAGVSLFDIEITAVKERKQLEIKYCNGKKNLQDWYKELNHVNLREEMKSIIESGNKLADISLEQYQIQIEGKNISLLSFNFQLNQLLMLINNPILFPHMEYAKLFCEEKEGEQENDE